MTKTVVAVDGSDYGVTAVRTAVELARRCHFEDLALVHVVSLKPGQIGTPDYPERPDLPETWPVFQEPLAIARAAQVQVRCQVLFGHPVEEILRFARQEETDLLILGSLGVSGIKELLLGSVATQVVAHAPCSVMVVRPGFRFNDG
jgi:nucleotide-binding universal stress UspA family protein